MSASKFRPAFSRQEVAFLFCQSLVIAGLVVFSCWRDTTALQSLPSSAAATPQRPHL